MDALRRFDSMREAFRAFDGTQEKNCREALRDAKIIGFTENLRLGSAFTVVRAFFEKLDQIESQRKAGDPQATDRPS
jgi:hypothetical protein